jgi:hypothetical protein
MEYIRHLTDKGGNLEQVLQEEYPYAQLFIIRAYNPLTRGVTSVHASFERDENMIEQLQHIAKGGPLKIYDLECTIISLIEGRVYDTISSTYLDSADRLVSFSSLYHQIHAI